MSSIISRAKKGVLPAVVYDTLELSAEAYGGIGCDRAFDAAGDPCCIIGHAESAVNFRGPALKAAVRVAITGSPQGTIVGKNDTAVRNINIAKGSSLVARVSFREWCQQLGIVRGDT